MADVTEPQAPAELLAATVERFGGVDIVVANAGGTPAGGSLEVDDDASLAAINANLLTSVRLRNAQLFRHARQSPAALDARLRQHEQRSRAKIAELLTPGRCCSNSTSAASVSPSRPGSAPKAQAHHRAAE